MQGVEACLHAHPSLFGLVVEARQQITTHFEPHAFVRLEVADTHQGFGMPELMARVRTKSSREEAVARLLVFDNNWWLANVPRP